MDFVRFSSAAEPNQRQSNKLCLVHYAVYISWELVAPATLLGHRLELEPKSKLHESTAQQEGCSTAFTWMLTH